MSFMKSTSLGALVFVAIAASSSPSASQNASTNFVPFAKFRADLSTAHAQDFARRPDIAVRDAAAFEEMRHYLVGLYSGMNVQRSFALDAQVFDCVPVMQQPSVRLGGISTLASPPPSPSYADGDNAMTLQRGAACAAGTIPMRRVTLDEITRFATLQQFLHKSEGEGVPHANTATAQHKYAFSYDFKNAYGSSTILNIWQPQIDQIKTQVFALSQSWDVGGSDATTQTAETGWQVYPSKYGTAKPTLFIYWTADNYNKTGCYNLDCNAFVQTSNKVKLGGPLSPSKVGGTQREIQLEYRFYKGAWWLWSGEWIGYYPVALYKNGALSKHTLYLEFGGEVVGTTSWPPMGSGAKPSKGYEQAAYQRNVLWLDSKGNAAGPTLTFDKEAPKCYSISNSAAAGKSSWKKPYFYFGGPGGTHC